MRPARLSAGLLRSFSRPSRFNPCFHPPSWRHAVSSQLRYSTIKSSDNYDTSAKQSTEAWSAAQPDAHTTAAESLDAGNDKALEDESALPDGSTKPYYVTTPIFYVNAAPHVGHMYSIVLADVLKRWQVLRKRQAYLCTGTDEHGMKVQRAAAKEGRAPQEFCDDNSAIFRRLAEESGVWNDNFIRTTDADHVAAVEAFWQRLVERGYIYESTHEGWYSVSDECFYPASAVETRYVPLTAKTIMASAETGSEVEWTKEKNYHFRMTALKHRLLEFYEANPDFIVPRTRMNEVVDWVKNNLEDLSVSRPVDRLDWGIRVPNDPSQTIYVWVDALVNYITYAGYPNWEAGEDGYGKWPADVHVVGKDIVRFHGVYWPALLMAVDLPLPKQLLSHAHWTMSKQKMSKSVGNVVNPFFAVDRWGVDAMRWYMLRDGGIEKDSDYSNEQILERYQHDLQGQLGNLLQRITRSKAWNHTQAVEVARGLKPRDLRADVTFFSPDKDKRMEMTNAEYRDVFLKQTRELREQISYLQFEVTKHMDALNPPLAAKAVMQVIKDTNKYISVMQPWNIEDRLAQYHIIYTASEALRISGILLQPFMPSKMGALLSQLGVARRNRSWKWARLGWDQWYGIKTRELKTGRDEALFPPPMTTK